MSPAPILFCGATVIPAGRDPSPRVDPDLLLRDGRIAAVGTGPPLPPGTAEVPAGEMDILHLIVGGRPLWSAAPLVTERISA